MNRAAEPPPPAVSLVVVAYESGATLARCLAATRAQSFEDLELILVDNGSRDGAATAAAEADPAIRFLRNSRNLGFAAAVNQAAVFARGRWLALLNPDAEPEPDWLEQLMAAAAAHPLRRSFTSRQLMAENPALLDGLGDVMSVAGFAYRGGYGLPDRPARVGEVFSPCGAAMMVDRRLFRRLGGFDERLFCYCEDVDLGYRLRLQGYPTLLVPEAVVRHVGAASSGGPRSDFAAFHGTRNRLWVYLKNTPPLLLLLTLPLHLLATAVLFARHWRRRELAAPWRGFRAALDGLAVALDARSEVQAARRCGSVAIGRAMSWRPTDLLARRPVIRPLPG